jgi:hypothetical protein
VGVLCESVGFWHVEGYLAGYDGLWFTLGAAGDRWESTAGVGDAQRVREEDIALDDTPRRVAETTELTRVHTIA